MAGTLQSELEQLERRLFRHGINALEAGRTRCVDCGRTPLIGEHVHLYDASRPEIVCELCRACRAGAPAASEIVRHSERGLAVRITARAA